MARKPQVDVRKLKDDVTENLKKSRWEKAAETLEELVAAEPKDMSHRLRLGDTYRRMDQPARAISQYQQVARFYADEGQLIKAIGAVKILLELDPRNAGAQKQLAEMNERRFGKVTLESAGLKPRPPAAPAGRTVTPIELDDEDVAEVVHAAPQPPPPALELGEDEPLELDDGKPTRRGAAPAGGAALPHRGFQTTPATPARNAIVPPPPPPQAEIELDLGDAGDELELEQLPDDAILEAEDLASGEDDAITVDDTVDDEIRIEEEAPPQPKKSPGAQPIADLVGGDAEEEIELLSISSEDEPVEAPAKGSPDEADLDSAFGKISPRAAPRKKKVPATKVPLFDDLSQDAFVELVNQLEYHRHVPGQLILREGDPGRSFYVIVEGKVRVCKTGPDGKELTLAHLSEGAFFGEMALLSGAPRTANVVAEEETGILEVTDVVLRDLAGRHPQVVRSLKNFYRQRLLNNVMAISPLFRDFDPSQRKAIVEKFRMRKAGPGEVLIREGAISDGLYVVLHGSVQVSTARAEQPIELARLKEGEIFGEMSLLTRQPATATVTSAGPSILLRLPREHFQELVVTHPQILELVSELTDRRKSATEAILQGQGEGHDGMPFV